MGSIKTCSRCKEHKSVADFAPSGRRHDAYCRACRRARYQENIKAELARSARQRAAGRARVAAGDPDVAATHTCRSCQQSRPVSDFFPSSVAARIWGKCRECRRVQYQANKPNEQMRHRKRQSDAKYRDANANRDLAKKYGMSLAKYEALLAKQGGHCACCGVEDIGRRLSNRLHVDHDHATGEIRGLLCHKCNIGIGALGDTAAGVRRALAYLERSAAHLNNTDTAGLDAGWLCH